MSAYRHLYRLPRLIANRSSAGRPGHPMTAPTTQHLLVVRDDGLRSSSSLGATVPINHETAHSVVAQLTNSERDALRVALSKFKVSPSSLHVAHQLEGEIHLSNHLKCFLLYVSRFGYSYILCVI